MSEIPLDENGKPTLVPCRWCGGSYLPNGLPSHEKWCQENPEVKVHGAPCEDRLCLYCEHPCANPD